MYTLHLSGVMGEKSHAWSSQIRRTWNPASCDDSRNRRQGDLSGYPGPERLRHPHPHPGLAVAGEPCSWILSREYAVALGRYRGSDEKYQRPIDITFP